MNNILYFFCIAFFLLNCTTNEKPTVPEPNTPSLNGIDTSAPKPATDLETVETFPKSAVDVSKIKEGTTSSKWMIVPGVRAGDIRKNSSLADLTKIYGNDNLTKQGIVIGGQLKDGSILKFYKTTFFANQPNEVTILWSDTARIQNPVQISVRGKGGNWETNKAIKVGTNLDYLIHLNGKDFYFLGFDDTQYEGQFNGLVTWNKGNISNSLGIVLQPSNIAASLDNFKTFQSLQKFPTNHPNISALGLTVKEIRMTFD